jgi:hypothetical protein
VCCGSAATACSAVLPDGNESKAVVRPYTPTSPPDAEGFMDLVVKVGGTLYWLVQAATLDCSMLGGKHRFARVCVGGTTFCACFLKVP